MNENEEEKVASKKATLEHKTIEFSPHERIVSVKCNMGGTIHGKCTTNIRSFIFITYTNP